MAVHDFDSLGPEFCRVDCRAIGAASESGYNDTGIPSMLCGRFGAGKTESRYHDGLLEESVEHLLRNDPG